MSDLTGGEAPPPGRPHFSIPAKLVQSQPIVVRARNRPYSRPSYSAHADVLKERTAASRQYAAQVADTEATESVFLQVRTPPELPVSNEKVRLNSAGLQIVALSPTSPSAATVQVRKDALQSLERKAAIYGSTPSHRGKSYLQIIDDLAPVPIEEKLSADLFSSATPEQSAADCLVVFYATLTDKERAAVLLAARSFIARSGGRLGEQHRFSNGVTAIEATLTPSQARALGESFTTLKQITPNRLFFAPDGIRISGFSPDVTVEPPQLSTAVAVVDTGISRSCAGLSTAVCGALPALPPGAVESLPEHGTFVASRIAYGDSLENGLRSGVLKPLCPLFDIPVIGSDSSGRPVLGHEGHLARAIDATLPALPDNVRVVNVSLGTNEPVASGTISLVAQLLDKHVRERQLVVVTTAGNIREPALLSGFPHSLLRPECRIDAPGESLLGLTVGSIAKHQDTGALSRPRELSAFSRRGPGPLGGLKPDLVAHGGNCLADRSTTYRIGTHGLTPDSHGWACDAGTSFAAPLVSAMAATLFDHYAGIEPNLVRALLLHFTDSVLSPAIGLPKEHLVGLGEPNIHAARWARDTAAAFLHTGELVANRHYWLPFYVPPCLAPDGSGRLRIRVTAVIDPPVNPDDVMRYSQARISLLLRKPAEVGRQDVSVSSASLDTDKWCPVEQIDRVFRRAYSSGEWQLQVRLWTRGLPAEHKQRFAVVVEVVDDSGTLAVRDEVERQVGTRFTLVPILRAA